MSADPATCQRCNLLRVGFMTAVAAYRNGYIADAKLQARKLGTGCLSDGLRLVEIIAVYNQAAAVEMSSLSPGPDLTALGAILLELLSVYLEKSSRTPDRKEMSRIVNEVRETEVRRIASLLHDEAAQMLAAVQLEVGLLAADLPVPFRKRAASIKQQLDGIEEQLRTFSHELRPPLLQYGGLSPALANLCDSFSRRSGIRAALKSANGTRYEPTVETAIYRFVAEALNNIRKHARASRASVLLEETSSELCCSVSDDGVGIPPSGMRAASSLGISIMRERLEEVGGTLATAPSESGGTVITACVPMQYAIENPCPGAASTAQAKLIRVGGCDCGSLEAV